MNVVLLHEVKPSEKTLYIVRQIAYKYRRQTPNSKSSKIFN